MWGALISDDIEFLRFHFFDENMIDPFRPYELDFVRGFRRGFSIQFFLEKASTLAADAERQMCRVAGCMTPAHDLCHVRALRHCVDAMLAGGWKFGEVQIIFNPWWIDKHWNFFDNILSVGDMIRN